MPIYFQMISHNCKYFWAKLGDESFVSIVKKKKNYNIALTSVEAHCLQHYEPQN